MSCINYHSPFSPLLSQLKHRQQLKSSSKLLWLSTNEPTELLQRQNIPSPVPLRTKAITTSLILAVSSPAKPGGDVSVFLQTSAVLLFAYWVTNFVVPDIISKYLQLDKTNEEDNSKANNPFEDEEATTPISSTPKSQAKKRGFNSPKP